MHRNWMNNFFVILFICYSNFNWPSKIKPKFLASVDGNICVLPTFIEIELTYQSSKNYSASFCDLYSQRYVNNVIMKKDKIIS